MWPSRGVAEFAYCPRLFYYTAVEGVFIPSADTEQGAGVHKRVDCNEDEASVPETDDALGLAEIAGTTASPAEPPLLLPSPQPWPTDHAQIGPQVLALEEGGYIVPEVWPYYAAEKLRLRVIVDEELRKFAMAALAADVLAG